MLDAASVSHFKATTAAAGAAKARAAKATDEGFHNRFREALETTTGEGAGWRSGAATKRAENPQPDPRTPEATAEATSNSGKNPATKTEDSAPKASKAETSADDAAPGMQAEARAAQQALASARLQESTLEQQQVLAQPLAASGPAQPIAAQAVAVQAPSKPQGLAGNPAPTPMTPAEEAVEAGKPGEPLSLLAKAFNTMEAAAELKLAMATETADASWRLASLEAPKAQNAKPSAEGRAEGISLLPQGFAPADAMALRAEAPLSSPPTRELPAPMPARQLAPVVVSLALGRGDEALTIALDPVELGRVEVSIGQGKEAGQLRIVAERPETLALLQRDQRELDRALNQAGLGDLARSLSFSLASDQGRQQQTGAEERGQRRASFTIGGVEGEGAMPGLPAPHRNATSLIDIAV